MTTRLVIDIPIEATERNKYASAFTEYTNSIQAGRKDVFLCYCASTKQYFVSYYFKNPESFNIKIIQ